ncbi:DUF3817 domain-containing protein [Sphaerimonospora cavernae]|uniref:DUF3817 domain-containing protein n=1 Tax=Sphaerimonospora cavernae TaxID=1740611 RepID=A0ABV6U4D9_9ACTN
MINVATALKFYRVMAYIVGVMLLALCGAMVAKYGFDSPTAVVVVGQAHGFLYMVYLVAAFNLGLKARWGIGYLILVLFSGTIPFLSFVMERNATDRVRKQLAVAAV